MDYQYPLHFIGDRKFEELVVLICQKILGVGVTHFAAGNDGGRDATFAGTAERYPSTASRWSGEFVVQAKHTSSPIARCSDSDFRTEIDAEVVKIKKLREKGLADNYLIFSNRTLTGTEAELIKQKILEQTGIINSDTFGKERISILINQHKEIADLVGLNKFLLPITFYENDLKELILFFSKNSEDLSCNAQSTQDDLRRIGLKEKNRLNKLGENYFKFMLSHSLAYFSNIDEFLGDPKNSELLKKYQATIADLQSKIIVHRDHFGTFEQIFDHLYDYILSKDKQEITCERRLIHVFLHYMYYNCDIGLKEGE